MQKTLGKTKLILRTMFCQTARLEAILVSVEITITIELTCSSISSFLASKRSSPLNCLGVILPQYFSLASLGYRRLAAVQCPGRLVRQGDKCLLR